jgi:P-type conjugative transfer protein TrbJ
MIEENAMHHHRARAFLVALLATTLSLIASTPARAQIVFDPTNYGQNLLQAARALEQVNNQLQSLTNEARMLQSLNLQLAPELTQSIQAARQLLTQAQGIKQNIDTIAQDVKQLYPESFKDLDLATLLRQSDRWVDESRTSFASLMRAGAASAGDLDDTQAKMNRALAASAGAGGQTAAVQASTQAIGVLSKQLAELQALQTAQARALAAEKLEQLAREERSRELTRRAFPSDAVSDAAPAQPRF